MNNLELKIRNQGENVKIQRETVSNQAWQVRKDRERLEKQRIATKEVVKSVLGKTTTNN